MNALGKIQACIASATQKTTLALANLKFDFALVKVEAPPEYRELGLALPKKRRSEGENGPIHVTAQRLGALFRSVLPETPNLIRVYGQRASEIAKSMPSPSQDAKTYGPFSEYLGIDGASVWAAATSSSPAIACHLLACMVACCWKSDEATAIWLEIVAERKSRLDREISMADSFNITDAVGSKDNSARAWLAAANESPVVRQRQRAVRCSLDKFSTVVDSEQDVFTSVMAAWKLALETLEKIICGMSCDVADGAVIVALLAWHVYPDLILLSPRTQEISQRDKLIETAGQVTGGLAPPDLLEPAESGVRWSLSLGHLRYYGPRQVSSSSVQCTPSGGQRFTFDEFVLLYLGSWFRQWFLAHGWLYPLFASASPGSPRPYRYRSLGLASLGFSSVLQDEEDRDSIFRGFIQDYLASTSPSGPKPLLLVLCSVYSRYLRSSRLKRDKALVVEEQSDGGFTIKGRNGRLGLKQPKDGQLTWFKPPRAIVRPLRKAYPHEEWTSTLAFQAIGETRSHALYSACEGSSRYPPYHLGIPFRQVQHYISTKETDPIELKKFCKPWMAESPFWAIRRCQEIYLSLPGVIISPDVLHSSFGTLFSAPQFRQYPLDQVPPWVMFLVIAFLETGQHFGGTMHAGDWDDVGALSTENTLYLHAGLVSSPRFGHSSGGMIRRVQGNIGKPGLTFISFTDLQQSMVKVSDASKWTIVNHRPYNGDLRDEFLSTTLHLRLTGYSWPLRVGGPDSKIAKASVVRAVLSAFDAGVWIGDLTAPWLLSRPLRHSESLLSPPRPVLLNPNCRANASVQAPGRDLVAIENWEELLHPHPSLPGVVKCHGNWQARLAATAICVQLGYRTIILDPHGCWDCAFKILDDWDATPLNVKDPAPFRRQSRSESSDEEESEEESEEGSEAESEAESDGEAKEPSAGRDSSNVRSSDTNDQSVSDDDSSSDSGFSTSSSELLIEDERPVFFIL
ncbi:hypothetical protein F5Y17DRAFT_469596 [Xylariaceae sp. FL0594]|nr:hypothetical protein F5Y17DRAFT_469596 [Xylariaceae sp. FL0594]